MKLKKVFNLFVFLLVIIVSIYIFSNNKKISNAQDLDKINNFSKNYKINSFSYDEDSLSYTINYPIFENDILNKKISYNIKQIENDFKNEFKDYNASSEEDKVYLKLETDIGVLDEQNLLFVRFYVNRNYLTYPNPVTFYKSYIYSLKDFEEVQIEDIFNDYSNLLYLKSKEYFKNNYGLEINESSNNYFDIAPKMENYQNIFIKNKFFEYVIFDYKKAEDVIIRMNLDEIKQFLKPQKVEIIKEPSSEIVSQQNEIVTQIISQAETTQQSTTEVTTKEIVETTTTETLQEITQVETANEQYKSVKDSINNEIFALKNTIDLDIQKTVELMKQVEENNKKQEQQKQLEEQQQNKRQLDPNKPMIALTFDDGPNGAVTNRILDVLDANNAKATFFVVGRRLDKDVEVLKRIHNSGNQIGNHTFHHKNLSQINSEQIVAEVNSINEKLKKHIGEGASIVRVPYGATNENVLKTIQYPLIMWNVDTKDWKTKNKDAIVAEIKRNTKDGNIILMHDLYQSTADACEIIIPELVKQGYQLVTIEELMQYRGIELKPGVKYFNGYKK